MKGRATRLALQTGERIVLRYFEEADREAYVALRRSSRRTLECWEPIPPDGFDAFGDDAFDRDLSLTCAPTSERLLICRRQDGELIGKLSFSDILRGPAQYCHIGYWIGEPFTGCGHMTEAIKLGLDHAFGPLGLHRVEANIQPHNEASRRVVRKCGFRLEGYSPRYIQIRGEWADHERWAMTVEEWRRD